jgi:tetratricopeptide (TPR) repeat protein
MRREIGDRHLEAWTLLYLGTLFFDLGVYDRARSQFERALDVLRQAGHLRGHVSGLVGISMIDLALGDPDHAIQSAREALRIAQAGADMAMEYFAQFCLGLCLEELGNRSEAADGYHRALWICRQLSSAHSIAELLAGLARLSLAEGCLDQAQQHAEQILQLLREGQFAATEHPADAHLACYRVLKASGDPRTREILENAYRFIQDRAAKISDEGERRSFLENVAANREIVEEYARYCQTKPIDCIGENE